MKLGVLGGTFDPIHKGHLTLAQTALTQLGLDLVLFVPAGDPPHKQDRLITPAQHRLAMLRLALSEHPKFSISQVDLNRPGPHYSTDTITLIRSEYQTSADKCFFIIGADSLMDLPTWRQPNRLLSLCYLTAAHRPGYQPQIENLVCTLPSLPQRLVWLEMPPLDIAATQLRQWIRMGKRVSAYLPDSVALYIADNKLYQAD